MKKLYISVLLTAFYTTMVIVQEKPGDSLKSNIVKIEVQPTYKTGVGGFYNYISSNMAMHMPKGGGKMIIKFVVEKDGSTSNVTILRSLGESTDKRMVKIIEKSPKWSPAMQDGQPVRAFYTLPITFNP